MVWRQIEPAHVTLDATGAPYNDRYGDVYASRDGALAQARHVFLRGNDLPERWQGRDQFVIVETGFGLGVNFLATWQAWRDDPRRSRRLHFVSVELHPVGATTLTRFAPEALAPLAGELAAQWPFALPGLHRLTFEGGAVTLTLACGDAGDLLPQLVAGADAFFLDGFTPDRNPQMWTPRLLKALTQLARDDATIATWSTARVVRDGLEAAGFTLELVAGFGHKRQMLRGRFAPRWRLRSHEPPQPYSGARDALVIGAGLAGSHVAYTLAARGWRVRVLERAARPAAGASALPVGLLHPQVTLDDNDAARLTRAGFFHAQCFLAHRKTAQGAFVQAEDDDTAEQWRALAQSLQLPAGFARFLDADEAAFRVGLRPARSGWWFEQGTTVDVRALCAALIQHAAITLDAGNEVRQLDWKDGRWRALDHSGGELATASVCVVANALDAARLLALRYAPVRPVRGRLSLVRASALAALKSSLSGGGTLARIDERTFAVGATYEVGEIASEGAGLDEPEVHRGNLERLARLLGEHVDAKPVGVFDATRCVAQDRLPMVGAGVREDDALRDPSLQHGPHLADLPRHAGLFASFAFGSRGLALAPLAAEWIAAQIEGEPWPVERDLGARIDLARFLLRHMRR